MGNFAQHIAERLGHRFSNLSLLDRALTHRSYGSSNNERLEFLGDALLGAIVAEQLFLKCPSEAEGSLTRIRASLVKGETLAELARELGMGQYLNLGSGELKSGGRRRDSILADALEALIGAIFLDSDMESAKAVVLSLYGDRIDSAIAAGGDKDAKTALQELLQSRGLTLPEYDIVETTGDPHERQFTVSCLVDVLEKPVSAVGNSKRAAEKSAARKALAELGKRGISYRG